MNGFDFLINAETEIEFFFTLSGSIQADLLRTHDNAHGYGMKLSMQQNLQFMQGSRRVIERKTTHVFTLYQDNTLTWEMLGQPPISGLKNIQQALERFRDAFEQALLAKPAQAS